MCRKNIGTAILNITIIQNSYCFHENKLWSVQHICSPHSDEIKRCEGASEDAESDIFAYVWRVHVEDNTKAGATEKGVMSTWTLLKFTSS